MQAGYLDNVQMDNNRNKLQCFCLFFPLLKAVLIYPDWLYHLQGQYQLTPFNNASGPILMISGFIAVGLLRIAARSAGGINWSGFQGSVCFKLKDAKIIITMGKKLSSVFLFFMYRFI